MIVNKDIIPEELQGCYEHHLNKWNQLAEDEPVVDHLGGRGGGQALHLADEDGRHHQHGGQVDAQGSFKEEGLEEGGGKSDGQQKEGREVSGHNFADELPLHHNQHSQAAMVVIEVQVPEGYLEHVHVKILLHKDLLWNKVDGFLAIFVHGHLYFATLDKIRKISGCVQNSIL